MDCFLPPSAPARTLADGVTFLLARHPEDSSVAVVAAQQRAPSRVTATPAGLCVGAGLAVWFALVAPVTDALSGWTPATLPPDWSSYRHRWETGHAIHAALFAAGFISLLVALLAETPDDAPASSRGTQRPPAASWLRDL